jgi:hypothetical protein
MLNPTTFLMGEHKFNKNGVGQSLYNYNCALIDFYTSELRFRLLFNTQVGSNPIEAAQKKQEMPSPA